jgi:hypothetical protein
MSITIESPRKIHISQHEYPLIDLFIAIGLGQQDVLLAMKTLYQKKLKPRILDSYPKELEADKFPYLSNLSLVNDIIRSALVMNTMHSSQRTG